MATVLSSLADPRVWAHGLRLLHYYAYSHVQQRRRLTVGAGTSMAPNVSFRNAERIVLGRGVHLGERCLLWAGDSTGRITIGDRALFAPEVFVTASNYAIPAGQPVMEQEKLEADVVIGVNSWLGARVVVVAGVTIGDGAIVGAGAVVTRDLPADCIAGGVPATVIGWRTGAVQELGQVERG